MTDSSPNSPNNVIPPTFGSLQPRSILANARIHPKKSAINSIVQPRKRGDLKVINYLPATIEGRYSSEEVHQLKKKLKTSDLACAVISCFGLIITWIENEIYYRNNNVSTTASYVMRSMVSISCFILNYLIYNHYKIQFEILKARKMVHKTVRFFRSKFLTNFMIETLFCWIHCPPGFDFSFPQEQLGKVFYISFDAYVSVIMLGRIYIFFRLFDHYTFWTGSRAHRVCRLMGFNPNFKFAIKSYLKYKSIIVLTLSLGLLILLIGLAVRTFERPYYDEKRKFNFDSIYNSFWCIIVTVTTIGYGDIYPVTHLGRLVTIIGCIFGIFVQSLFVVTLSNILQLTREEGNAFEELTRKNSIKKKLQKDAGKLIAINYRLYLLKKKKTGNLKEKMLMRMDLAGLVKRFKLKRKNVYNISQTIPEILEEMGNSFSNAVEDVCEINYPFLMNSLPILDESIKFQEEINEKTVRLLKNSQKIAILLHGKKEEFSKFKSFDEFLEI